jgi:hypothetical protein
MDTKRLFYTKTNWTGDGRKINFNSSSGIVVGQNSSSVVSELLVKSGKGSRALLGALYVRNCLLCGPGIVREPWKGTVRHWKPIPEDW